jgi:metallo-beta-lactamase class B
MQIIPGVYLINGFPYGQHQNSYVVRDEGLTILVDSGDLRTDAFPLALENAARWGIDLAQVDYMLITHAHFDHSSHAARLQRLGVRLVASADTAEAMAAGDDRCIGYAVNSTYEPCQVDQIVSDGEALSLAGRCGGHLDVQCIAAPGHADGCSIYQMEPGGQRVWFAGDVVLVGEECASARPGWNGGPDYDRKVYLETLRRLAHMPCDTLFPGHGPPAIGGGRRMVEMAFELAMTSWR